MRKRSEAAVVVGVALTLAIAFFFLAPVFEQGDLSAVDNGPMHYYSSLGCETIGLGTMYGQNTFGYRVSCDIASLSSKWYQI